MRDILKRDYIDIFFVYSLAVLHIIIFSLYTPAISVPTPFSEQKEEAIAPELFNGEAFSNLEIEGKAYIVYDIYSQKIIASKNETMSLPLASITKVMTAISALTHKDKSEKIILNKKSIEDGFDLGLRENQVWSLGELLKYTLVFSSNDGAQAVADSFGGTATFVEQMNADAKALGLTATFTDPAGRDQNGKIGGLGTVYDVAKLFEVARKNIPDLLDATNKKRSTLIASNGRISGVPNTNQEVEDFPGAEASKTGYTDLAGGNLGIIVDITLGHPVVIVVLGSTREGRFKDVETLYQALQKSVIIPKITE